MLNLSPREYQKAIFETAKNNNTLVVLPTGLGKTLIALMLSLERKKLHPLSRILILAPTRPLVEQHFESFKKNLPELYADLQIFTGSVPASQRKKIFQTAEIIFSTPQCIANDLNKCLYSLNEVSLLVIDEAHRCLKNYDYTKVVEYYKRQSPIQLQRILGLTASPGSDSEIIRQICDHLDIKEIESRTRHSEDVKAYLQELEFNKIEVEFPKEFIEIKVLLQRIWDNCVARLQEKDILRGPANKITLLKLQQRLFNTIQSNPSAYFAVSLTAQAIKISHALELLETQTLSGLNEYFQNLLNQAKEQKSKAVQILVKSPEFNAANISLMHLLAKKTEHPKIQALSDLVKQEFNEKPNAKIIIFSQFRETAQKISSTLNEMPNIKSSIFIGQAKKSNTKGISSGFSQKEQREVIEKFKSGELNVLAATSVHPEEFIVLKKENKIFIKKIGEFVESFLKKGELTKQIAGYEALTTDGKRTFFGPITHVHKHPSKMNCAEIKLSSGFDCIITEDHSLFSFDKEKKFTPETPELNKFVALNLKCPNLQSIQKIDVLESIQENSSDRNLFGTLCGLSQPKMRELKTDFMTFSLLKEKERNISQLSRLSKKDYSTILNCLRRSLKHGLITQKKSKKNWSSISSLTEEGKSYLRFLEWFFNNVKYSKGKYRFVIKNPNKLPGEFNKFFEQKINVCYGKTNFPRFIDLNEATARFLGFYVSEGHARRTEYGSDVFLAAQVKKMQEMMKSSIKEGLHLKTRQNAKGIAIDSQIAYHLIKNVFKAGIGAYHKEVPEAIFTSPDKIKWAFIEAYCLGDGHIAKDKIVFTTVSRKLVTGLTLLLRMLGIEKISVYKQNHIYRLNIFESLPFAKIKEKNKTRCHAYYSLVPTALNSQKAFNLYNKYFCYNPKQNIRCRKNGKWNEDICYDYIKKLSLLNKQPDFVYDLTVEKTENFIGGTGLFVLHNSIAEEGLDIPEVNAVVFYEPIPSAIRKIQRTGRTARLAPGKLFILITKDTRDEINHYASSAREKKMHKALEIIKQQLKTRPKPSATLSSFQNTKPHNPNN